jgi:hypothetical protein
MGEFLRSTEGDRYRAELYAARVRLRGEMKGKAWSIENANKSVQR